MVFESPVEKLVLVSAVALALAVAGLVTGFFNHLLQPPAPKEKISASNYPNYIVKEEIPSEKLALTYNPELAIVSPDRTPFIDLVLKIKNEQDVPRTLKLVFPDPATLLTDDPRFVVAHTTFKDENTGQTYHRLVLFLPEKAEKEVKIRYENAYAALDDLKHDVTLELYNEDDQKVADITYRLRSVVLGFKDIWTLPTLPTTRPALVFYRKEVDRRPRISLVHFTTYDRCVISGSQPAYSSYTLPSDFNGCPFVEVNISLPQYPSGTKYDIYASYGGEWNRVASNVSGNINYVAVIKTPRAIKVSAAGYCTQSTGSVHHYYVVLNEVKCMPFADAKIMYREANTTYDLASEDSGNFVAFKLPPQVQIYKNAVNKVPVVVEWGDYNLSMTLPLFYDPDRSDDLLWRIYEQWKNSLEVNSQ